MVEEQKDKGFVEDREVTVSTIELKVNRNNEEVIDKITLETNKGNITWKPKVSKTTYEGGFKVLNVVSMEKDLIPKILQEIAAISNERGTCKVKLSYTWWKTEQDGEKVTYRFITSAKTLEKWKILSESPKEEKVSEIEQGYNPYFLFLKWPYVIIAGNNFMDFIVLIVKRKRHINVGVVARQLNPKTAIIVINVVGMIVPNVNNAVATKIDH